MEFFDIHIQATLFLHYRQQVNASEGICDLIIGCGAVGVGVESDTTLDQERVLSDAGDSCSNLLTRDGREVNAVDADAASG